MPFRGVCWATVSTIHSSSSMPYLSLNAARFSEFGWNFSLSTPFGMSVVETSGAISRTSLSQRDEMVMMWSKLP